MIKHLAGTRLRGLFVCALLAATALAARPVAADDTPVDPLQCWWRTTAAAVRVGAPFTLVLTCAVVETPSLTVVPDQSGLDAAAIQLPPFELLGGAHGPDLRGPDHRFFQYEYRLRVLSEDLFGKDVKLPDTKITYKIQTRTADGAALEGRDQTYFLPALTVRVLSLVPAEASDIRDAGAGTFSQLDARRFRAALLHTVAGVLGVLAALAAILALVRAWQTRRAPVAADDRLLSDRRVLQAVRRELRDLARAHQDQGWTPSLTNRLVTALRLAAAAALGHPARPLLAEADATASDGHLLIRRAGLRTRPVRVAGATTPRALADALARPDTPPRVRDVVAALQPDLDALTAAQFGRGEAPTDTVCDAALATGQDVVGRLIRRATWPAPQIAALERYIGEVRQHGWSR